MIVIEKNVVEFVLNRYYEVDEIINGLIEYEYNFLLCCDRYEKTIEELKELSLKGY